MTPVAKILGADVELSNVLDQTESRTYTNDVAARRLLAQIDGVRSGRHGHHADADPQDCGRKFLPSNGGCVYIDLGHLEVCTPEVRSARDFVRYLHAAFALASRARAAAAAALPDDAGMLVMANNSDRQGNSWGGHLNVLITRELHQRLFDRLYPELFILAAFQVSSILYTGQGKVGAENGKPWTNFQLTQRGDFFECVEGLQTTHRRPLINSRDEAHCGQAAKQQALARLHTIFHDTTLTHTSNYLKAGVTQLVLALMETGWCDTGVMLQDPLRALTAWGHDPTLGTCAPLASGTGIGMVDHQRLFLRAVQRFVSDTGAPWVPEAHAIVRLWEETLDRLERRDTAWLMRRLDWVLKRELLDCILAQHPDLDWHAPAMRAADLLFAALGDDSGGLYSAVAAQGGVEELVSARDIELALQTPPNDTRAWLRALLLRHSERSRIESVNWDEICLRPAYPEGSTLVLTMDDPRSQGHGDLRHLLDPRPDALDRLH